MIGTIKFIIEIKNRFLARSMSKEKSQSISSSLNSLLIYLSWNHHTVRFLFKGLKFRRKFIVTRVSQFVELIDSTGKFKVRVFKVIENIGDFLHHFLLLSEQNGDAQLLL